MTADPLLTIFAIPKPFDGLTAVHQANAVRSWLHLGDDVDVVLCGDDPGVRESARSFGVQHIPTIARNRYGTPLVSAAFEQVTSLSRATFLCYTNADIMFTSDLRATVRAIRLDRFLMCGQRWDVDMPTHFDFQPRHWECRLLDRVHQTGTLHSAQAMDYFVSPRGLFGTLPPLVVGRAMWDNWLVFHARSRRIPVLDATRAITAVHQNHDYRHVRGGVQEVWYGAEAHENRIVTAEMLYPFTLEEATADVLPHGALRPRRRGSLMRNARARIALALRRHVRLRRLVRFTLRAAEV
jgi:hypothetical protein